jgi:hypothetical protein
LRIFSESNNAPAYAAGIGYKLISLENALQINYNGLMLTNI